MTPGLMVQLLLEVAGALGQAGDGPKEAIFSSAGSIDDRADFNALLLPSRIDLSGLPEKLKLTRRDIVDLDQRFRGLLWQCRRGRIIFTDPRGTGIRLTAKLSGLEDRLLEYITKKFGLVYSTQESPSGKGVMVLILDLIDLLEVTIDTPTNLYLDFQQGCADGSFSVESSFKEACMVVEGELNPRLHQLEELSTNIWQLARQEEVIVNEGLMVVKINLRAELSSELEVLAKQLFDRLRDYLRVNLEKAASSRLSNEPPDSEVSEPELPSDSATEVIQEQLGLS